ncbi:BatA and WFA domain-containing protein [bacterium]|nr:BatA and WFA domain-containing protein [bacterium]
MNFMQPLALIASLLAGLIVLMYLLKLRRQREQVSSTLLWQKTIEDLIANAPFQKLRQNLLMYIQILALLAIVIALARPTMWLNTQVQRSRIILIDNSASMNAADGRNGMTRLEEAKAIASELVGNMQRGDQFLIATFGGSPRVLQPFTPEKATLARAVRAIEPTEAAGQIREALTMVRGVRKAVDTDKSQVQLTIISDGALGYLGNLIQKNENVQFFGVGSEGINCGIIAFDARESFEHRGQIQVFAEVENFGEQEVTQLVRCLIDGKQASIKEIKLAPHGRQGVIFTDLGASAQTRKVRLELAGAKDLLACDDAVQGVIHFAEKTRILLVSRGSFFLERALALAPGVTVARVDPDKYQPAVDYDLTVFDGFSPPKIGAGKYLFINAAPHVEGFSAGPKPLAMQTVLDWNRIHPIMRYAELGDLAVAKVLDMKSPDWMIPLVDGEVVPMVLAGERQGLRIVCIPFDLFDSDWPLQVSFPIFFSNAINWLLGAGEGSVQAVQHLTGDMVRIEGLRIGEGEQLAIKGPAGRSWRFEPNTEGSVFFNQTLNTGLYDYSAGGKTLGSFAVNLLSREESNIKPIASLTTGERQIERVVISRQNREIWRWFVLAALALLVLEWHIYGRRSWL